MKYPIKAGFHAVARILNFPYVNHLGHDGIFTGLTLECMASYHTLCTLNILGMHKIGGPIEKSWRGRGGTTDGSSEGDWMPLGGLILNALTSPVDEKRHVFSGQQPLALWR